MMSSPQDEPPNENSPLHWVLCSEYWEDLVIIVVPDLNTTLLDINYLNVSTQHIMRSHFDGAHSEGRKSRKKLKRVKKN